MRLSRMGSMFPSRLSFLRVLIRMLATEHAVVDRSVWEMDASGVGYAVYSVPLGGEIYSLVAVTQDLDPSQRTDRVIATAWDAAFVLYDGEPTREEIERIRNNAPLQEAGRFSERDLVLSRANKSVRLFDHVVQSLKQGTAPDTNLIHDIGYLMRTTAVYGNGKFGIADRTEYGERGGLMGPFMAEMLTVWLIRGFTHDLVEHVGGGRLPRVIKRDLGIGNATGLGMAPFLVSHPDLLNNWMKARETALARVRALDDLTSAQTEALMDLARQAVAHLWQWNVPDPNEQARIDRLRRDWGDLCSGLPEILNQAQPIDELVRVSAAFSEDVEELVVSMVIEPFGDLVDHLAAQMGGSPPSRVLPMRDTIWLRTLIEDHFGWALDIDFEDPANTAQFWYVSADKQEPRLGMRHEEPGAELESPLDVARQAQALWTDLLNADGSIGSFLRAHPEHRWIAARMQNLEMRPYGEIHDNLIGKECRPIDMLRCKLSFFGASKFDPKSDRWTRITLAQSMPLFDELETEAAPWLPVLAS